MIDNDIIDNRDYPLTGMIATYLERYRRAHILLGHLFIPGMSELILKAARAEEIRILIGNTTHRETIEQLFERHLDTDAVKREIERHLYVKRPELRRIIRKAAEDLGETISLMDQSDANLEVLRVMSQLIESRTLQFRIYPRGRLGLKACLFESQGQPTEPSDPPELAILGSTNLSHSQWRIRPTSM